MRVFLFGLFITLVGTSTGSAQIDADVLLQGGTIYDGTGSAGVIGDVAIKGDRIVGVGRFTTGTVLQTIDCSGLVIAPGFIDLHTHSDRGIVTPDRRANMNYLMQGCTTVVTGNCGSGPVHVGEYYQKIEQHGAGTNVAHLLPQGSLRSTVLGTTQRKPTPLELNRMQSILRQAMDDGAWGMSTGLIYVPSSYADTEELIALAKVVAERKGIYVSHIRNENVNLLAAVAEALKIGQEAELPVHISHFKSSGRESWGLVRRAADLIEQAQQKQKVTADQYPYIASSTSLDATLIPTWARAGGRSELIKRLDNPETGPRIKSSMAATLKKRDNGDALWIVRHKPRPDWVGKSVGKIAQLEKKTPLEIALTITRNGGASIVNFSMDEADVRHIMQRPWVATASDGGTYLPGADRPHPRNYGTFPRKIGHYGLKENVLPVAQAIRSASGLPADILTLKDRGYLKVNHFADVVVFDPKTFIDVATFDDPHQYANGVRYLYVNGQSAVYRGRATGNLAGKPLRHPKWGVD